MQNDTQPRKPFENCKVLRKRAGIFIILLNQALGICCGESVCEWSRPLPERAGWLQPRADTEEAHRNKGFKRKLW